jgi:fumarate hydratase class I
MIKLKTPINEEQIRQLKAGDKVLLSGVIYTARDKAHKFLVENNSKEFKEKLKDGIIYHCGPIVKKENNNWKIISAGPTTSIREEPYEADVIENYKVKAVIGKGGMGKKTLEACKKFGCVYLHAVGGAAAVLAENIKKVKNVYKLEEFGIPEAFWELEVEDFPAIVTMDANGNSLHKDILDKSKEKYLSINENIG